MDPIGFAVTVLGLGLRDLAGWPYGVAGVLGLALLLWGARARSQGSACVGAFILAVVLMAHGV